MKHPYRWEPVPHTYIKDKSLQKEIGTTGYKVIPFLNEDQLNALRKIYTDNHSLSNGEGAMFYSVYSQDLEYRQKVHEQIGNVINSTLDKLFWDYKVVLNGFSIKIPGKESGFRVHQDTTGLDEFKYSALSLWYPLWDVNKDNGTMCMIPKSQSLFSPFRGISFGTPFDKVSHTAKKYLVPVDIKAGELLIFDNRVLHASLPNKTKNNRVAIITGIFPKVADFQICYKASNGEMIEIYSQEDDFILKYPNFMHNCMTRPVTGKVIGMVKDLYPQISELDFKSLMAEALIPEVNLVPEEVTLGCNPVSEPDGIERELLMPTADIEKTEPRKSKKGFLSRIFG